MKHMQVDLCVVGGAGGGLSAAVRAKQLGVEKVVVLEKMRHPGGCTQMAAGMFAVDSPVQKRFGYHYNADEAFTDLIRVLNWNVDAMLVRKWMLGSGENIRWLEDQGMEFDGVEPFNGVKDKVRSTYHLSRKSGYRTGKKIVDTLLASCEKLGVAVLTQTRATKLLRSGENKVNGVIAIDAEGEELQIDAKAVILSTGSISSNKELIQRFYNSDEYKDIRIMANVPHNTGDGLIMAEEIGAGTGQISTLYIGPHNHFPGASEVAGSVIRRPHPLRVNRNGERVADEGWNVTSEFGWMIGVNLDKQPGKVVYGIIDAALLEHMQKYEREPMTVCEELVTFRGNDSYNTGEGTKAALDPGQWLDLVPEETKKEEKAGRAKICNTVAEIAAYIGCDEAELQNTIDRYNSYCKTGYDADFLKDPRFLRSIDTPPYYVYQGPSGIDTCIGGLLIDNHQRVLDTESYAIPGLYAAGVLTSGWCAGNYAFFGSEMSYTIYSGRSAAESAYQYINQEG